jgi:hypothetical protein
MDKRPTGMSRRIVIAAIGGCFILLGLLFIGAPTAGAALFGFPSDDPTSLVYVRALGLRDVGLGGYVLALLIMREPRALTAVALVSVCLPLGDAAIVGVGLGSRAWINFALHLAGAALLLVAAVLSRRDQQDMTGS